MNDLNKRMIKKVKSLNYNKMNKIIDIIHKETGKSKLYIRFDIIMNFLTRGIGYTDYFRGNYINLTKKEKDTYVGAKSFYKVLHYLNNYDYVPIFNNKLIFNKYFSEYIKRDFINLKICTYKDFEEFIKNHKIVFAKDPVGEGGHGISKIDTKNENNIEDLYNKLVENGQFLVEDEIVQSKELDEINPNVVNSFRVVTLVNKGKAYVINNALRVNQDDSEVIGCTNDLYFSFNDEGIIDSNVIDDYGNIYKKHPLTGKEFNKVKIKDVKEAFELCKKAALEIQEVRYVGWDVAFSKNGPLIVEGNEYPGYGLFQFYKLKNKKTGHLKEIEDIIGDEIKNIK